MIKFPLYVIYVREDNGSSIGHDYMALMDHMDIDVPCPRKAVKLNYSLTAKTKWWNLN